MVEEEEEEADGMVPSLFGDDRVTSVACNLLFDFIVIFIFICIACIAFQVVVFVVVRNVDNDDNDTIIIAVHFSSCSVFAALKLHDKLSTKVRKSHSHKLYRNQSVFKYVDIGNYIQSVGPNCMYPPYIKIPSIYVSYYKKCNRAD